MTTKSFERYYDRVIQFEQKNSLFTFLAVDLALCLKAECFNSYLLYVPLKDRALGRHEAGDSEHKRKLHEVKPLNRDEEYLFETTID